MDKFGIFEVDCRQRSESDHGLSYVRRALPFQDRIERIHAFARQFNIPTVFTTCCSNRLLSKNDCRGALVVPMDVSDLDWTKDVHSSPSIYIEKTTWGSPEANTRHCAWEMFQHNGNAKKLFEKLGIRRWIVYGVGIDLCVNAATRGLLDAGCEVVILRDILVNNAGGTPESMEKILADLGEKGVKTMSFDDFIESCSRIVA